MGEQIGILLLFLVVVLFNLIGAFVNRRRKQEAADKTEQIAPRVPVPPRVVIAPPRVEGLPPAPMVARTPSAPLAPVRGRRRLDLRRGDLRRAIVLMTVLGPPRALEHEAHDATGPRYV